MKKLLLIVTATLVCVSAFAQGKIQFANDSSRVAYFTTDLEKLMPADAAVANNALTVATIGSLAGAPSLLSTLWAGTSASSLSLQTTVTGWSIAAGRWSSTAVTLPTGFPAGTMAYFQIQIYDSRATDAEDAWSKLGWYAGKTDVFTAIPQAAANPIYQTTSPVNSTWPVGTKPGLIGSTGLGAIEVYATVPEPGSFALIGLGLASLLIFRRR